VTYKTLFDNLNLIFNTSLTLYTYDQVVDDIVPAIASVIYLTSSKIYTEHLFKLEYAISETSSVFARINSYADQLNENNKRYQPNIKEENTYVSSVIKTAFVANDFISLLALKYPNQSTYKGLIVDGDFNYVISLIKNLYSREIETLVKLIDSISTDYKLYRSLETFIVDNKSQEQKSLFNKTLYTIMSNFDQDILNTTFYLYTDRLSSSLTQFFNKETPSDSFTYKLNKLSLLTEPLYDILNYYRLFTFYFLKQSSGTALIFDLLFTTYIHSKSITNQQFNTIMKDLFEIKLNNIDYINVNTSKINESLTSKYESLNYLNYFNIQPYINILKTTNISSYTNITQLTQLFQTQPHYNQILFTIIENILYSNADLSIILQKLSIRSNIRTILTKLFFQIAISKLITTISTYYSNNIPPQVKIYPILIDNTSDFIVDLNYLKSLITISDFYKGNSTSFNLSKITN
jgi:hypothetical protein